MRKIDEFCLTGAMAFQIVYHFLVCYDLKQQASSKMFMQAEEKHTLYVLWPIKYYTADIVLSFLSHVNQSCQYNVAVYWKWMFEFLGQKLTYKYYSLHPWKPQHSVSQSRKIRSISSVSNCAIDHRSQQRGSVSQSR